MKPGKFLKVNLLAAFSALLLSPVLASATETGASLTHTGLMSLKANALSLNSRTRGSAFGAALSGKSMGSVNTIGFTQGEDFLQSVGRRQNKLHEFSGAMGSSEAFFGEDETFKAPREGGSIMDFILQQMNVSPQQAEALPQLWTDTSSHKGKVEASNGFDTYDFDTNGFSGGIDIKADNALSFGMAVGYSRSSSTFEALGETSTAVDGYHAALYTSYAHSNLTLDNAFSFTLFQNSSERSLLANEQETSAKARATGYQIGWSLSAMGQTRAGSFSLTPVAGFTFASLHNGGMKEEGAGALDLSAEKSDHLSFKPMLGLDVARTYMLREGFTLTPEVYGIYRYEMLGAEENARTHLTSFSDISMAGDSTRLSRHSMQLGASVGAKMGDAFVSKLQFDSDMKPSAQEYRAVFKLSYVW